MRRTPCMGIYHQHQSLITLQNHELLLHHRIREKAQLMSVAVSVVNADARHRSRVMMEEESAQDQPIDRKRQARLFHEQPTSVHITIDSHIKILLIHNMIITRPYIDIDLDSEGERYRYRYR
jgi:hypothetical protein